MCARSERRRRAGGQQPERGRESECAGKGALRQPPGNSAPEPCARRAVPPPPPQSAPGHRQLPCEAGVWSGQGSPPGDWGIPVQPTSAETVGSPVALQHPPAELRGQAGGGAPGRPEGRAPDPSGGAPIPWSVQSARAPVASDLALIPRVPHFCTNFSDALARGGRGERWAAPGAPAPPSPSR